MAFVDNNDLHPREIEKAQSNLMQKQTKH